MESIFSFPAQVNERAARVVAGVVSLSLTAAIALHLRWVAPVLAAGFLLRVGWGPRFSPLARAAMFIASSLWTVLPVAGAPKRFAQGIGAACTVGASALFALGADRGAWTLCAMVVVFAALEASVAFCMGCWLYARLFPRDACPDCAAP